MIMKIFYKFDAEDWLRICQKFEITRTIYSNVERSEQFLKLNNLLLEVSQTTIDR